MARTPEAVTSESTAADLQDLLRVLRRHESDETRDADQRRALVNYLRGAVSILAAPIPAEVVKGRKRA